MQNPTAVPRQQRKITPWLAAITLTTSLALPVSAQTTIEIPAHVITQTCQSYKQAIVSGITASENAIRGNLEEDNPGIRLSSRERQEMRQAMLQGYVNQETDRDLRRIITNAANRYMTTGRPETFVQELRGFDEACQRAMPERLSKSQQATRAAPRATQDNTDTERQADTEPRTPTSSSHRYQLPEATPLRR